MDNIGTPPPARGPRAQAPSRAAAVRNTPACAGTTTSRSEPGPGPSEHPRLRGDHALCQSGRQNGDGTPPPARGPPPSRAVPRRPRRNTPACAGTTRPGKRSPSTTTEHPRLRGDHGVGATGVTSSGGTPPPARGPRIRPGEDPNPVRNTPACAGTTIGPAWTCGTRAEHPRLRGDHEQPADVLREGVGTPPPARGPLRLEPVRHTVRRNTPACAGTTPKLSAGSSTWSEHPRLRGDHSPTTRPLWRQSGTPPPARGPQGPRAFHVGAGRNTPACAGTTLPDLRS